MFTYVPFNSSVFFAALNGAVAGLLGESVSFSAGRGVYTSTLEIAGAYAQSVDTAWGTASNPDQFEQGVIFDFSNNFFSVNEPQGNPAQVTPATYTPLANSLLAILADGESYLASIGVVPGAIAGGSSGNYVTIARGAPANYATPTSSIVAAIVATPQASGIFRITASLGVIDSASEEVTIFLFGANQAAAGTPITLGGGTNAGKFGSTAGANALAETMTAASTAMTVTGGTVAKELSTKSVAAIGTDATEVTITGTYDFSTGGAGAKVPFNIDETCVLYLTLTAAAGTLSGMTLDFAVEELAAA